MLKLFPSQFFFDPVTERRYVEWMFRKTKFFLVSTVLLIFAIISAITIANICISGFETVLDTVFFVRIAVAVICLFTLAGIACLEALQARKILFYTTLLLTVMAFLDTYFWVWKVGYFTPEAQMITIYMFMMVPVLNVEHKVITGFLVLAGLVVCWYIYRADIFWSLFYAVLMYVINIVLYYKFDLLLRLQYQTICSEHERSNRDMLTGVYNKNAFVTMFREDINSLRAPEKMLVGVVDIDCFKEYNDSYGHLAGDKVLAQVAQALLSFGFDRVYRFGGEEFVFTLKREVYSREKAPNVCGVIAGLNIPHQTSLASEYLTISAGIITVMRDNRRCDEVSEKRIDSIVQKADANMYEAKKQGRNQSVVSRLPLVV